MKKAVCFMLVLILTAAFVSACESQEGKFAEKVDIVGKWNIEALDFVDNENPLLGTLAKVLYDYLSESPQIEFFADNTAIIGGTSIDYEFTGDTLTLIWGGNQKFLFDVSEQKTGLKLNYQNYLGCRLERSE